MPGLFIIAHAPLASALKVLATHVNAEAANAVVAFDVPADAPLEVSEAQAARLLSLAKTPEALILTDVFGATPCNIAMRLAAQGGARVAVGVNVPMLWRALCYRHEPLDQMLERALAGATQGVMQVTVPRPQNQANPPTRNDSIDRQDQQ
jgi:mannose PTS system EIIA component